MLINFGSNHGHKDDQHVDQLLINSSRGEAVSDLDSLGGGGALRAMTQLTEVTAPIRPTTPTIPEPNLMAEVQETESANHRQLVSRIRGTSRNLTSLSSLRSPRHNCGALGVLRTSHTSKGPQAPRKTRYSDTYCCAIGLKASTRSGNSGVFRQACKRCLPN